jgi:hypothetical protein
VRGIYEYLVWMGGHFETLLLLLPWAVGAATDGFGALGPRRLIAPARTALHPRYWLTLLAGSILGVSIPSMLMGWTPDLPGVPAETASLVVRFLAAYALAVTAWLFLISAAAAWAGARSPRSGQV